MKTINVYTLEELKGINPAAYEKIHEKWARLVAEDIAPWPEEVMDSLKAVVSACGARLKDWSIGVDEGSVSVRVEDLDDDDPKDAAWMLANVLAPNGYIDANGAAEFPGHCKFTGYCADDDFLEVVYKAIVSGDTLTDALECLGSAASRMMRDDMEQQQEEESMLANWGANEYTEDGTEV